MRTSREANPPSVRVANVTDSLRIAEVNRLSWQHAYAGLVPAEYLASLDEADLAQRWHDRLESPPLERLCFVAELDDLVASYAVGGTYRVQQDAAPEDTTGWGELYALYADPAYQGRGAGTAVQAALLDALAAQGFVTAALWMLRANDRTRRWYVNHGWHLDGATSSWSGAGAPLPEVRLVRSLGARRPPYPPVG